MDRFMGTVQGSRGEAGRQGTKDLTTRCNGWDRGVRVFASKDRADGGMDIFTIYVTAGSGNDRGGFQLADIAADGTISIYNSKGETALTLTDLVKS